jgi:guanylate kinase
MQPCGLLFILSGPAAVGKNTIMRGVLSAMPTLKQLPTATTRPPRADEQEGREHEFLSESEFRRRILDKALIEWQIIHDISIYGVPRATIQEAIRNGQPLIADIDVLGGMQLKQEFGDSVVLIFVESPDKTVLAHRMRRRSDVSDEEVSTRLRRVDFEHEFADDYDYTITNREGQLEASIQETLRIIKAACERAANQMPAEEATIGWDPNLIQQVATGLIVQAGKLLMNGSAYPHIQVPADKLPFEALQAYIQRELKLEVVPTRPDAITRKVDIAFEPAQLIRATHKAASIDKNFIYVLHLAAEVLEDELPSGWRWIPIENLHLDSQVQNILLQAEGQFQPD